MQIWHTTRGKTCHFLKKIGKIFSKWPFFTQTSWWSANWIKKKSREDLPKFLVKMTTLSLDFLKLQTTLTPTTLTPGAWYSWNINIACQKIYRIIYIIHWNIKVIIVHKPGQSTTTITHRMPHVNSHAYFYNRIYKEIYYAFEFWIIKHYGKRWHLCSSSFCAAFNTIDYHWKPKI